MTSQLANNPLSTRSLRQQPPARKLLARGVSTVLLGLAASQAQAFGGFGTQIDNFCAGVNGATPYQDQSCTLCHSNNYGEYISPEWDWWYDNGQWANFCGEVITPNEAPVLGNIGDRNAQVGNELSFTISATDADGDNLSFSATGLPNTATLDDNGDGSATFRWTPMDDQTGDYDITFNVTDDGDPMAGDEETITISVSAANSAPQIDPIGNQSADIGSELSFTVSASDADGDNISLSAANLPTGASFMDNGDGSGSFSWTPSEQQIGNFPVSFKATDDGDPAASSSEEIVISVSVDNQPPVLDSVGNQSAEVGSELSFTVNASDPDGDGLALSAANLPDGASFTDNLDGSGSFSWTPSADQAGSYSVLFSVTDNGVPQASDSEEISISVGGANNAPVLDSIGNQNVDADNQLSLTINASDADGNPLSFSASGLPDGAMLMDNNNGTATLSWTPTSEQVGQHEITVNVADDQLPPLQDSETFTITVGGGNQPPVLASIGQRAFDYGLRLELPISATDADGDYLSISASNLPAGAMLTDYGNGTAQLSWTPTSEQIGEYSVSVRASDASSSDEETFGITVRESDGVAVNEGESRESDSEQTVTWSASGSPWGLLGLLGMGLYSFWRRRTS
jgi:MYXO-CTERM domain-containing protein